MVTDPNPAPGRSGAEARTSAELAGLLSWLRDGRAVTERRDFTVGTAMPDGRLDLCKQDLGPRGAALVTDALRPGPVKHLLLGTNALGDAGAATAAAAVPVAELDTLYLGCNNISTEGACSIADGLRASPQSVAGIWLKRNPLGSGGGAAATGLVEAAGNLRTLDLTQTRLDAAAVGELVDALLTAERAGRPVTRVYLGGNDLGEAGARQLGRLIVGGGIAELFTSAAGLGDAGAVALAEALDAAACSGPAAVTMAGTAEAGRGPAATAAGPAPARLSYLSVASNGIGPSASARLVTAAVAAGTRVLDLGRVRAARVLGAAGNRLDTAAVTVIAAALTAGPHQLSELVLTNCGLGDEAAELLVDSQRRAPVPTRITLGKGVSKVHKRRLAELGAAAEISSAPSDVSAVHSVYRTVPSGNTH